MTKWKYYVDDIEQTFMRRVYPTKTFKGAASVVCAAALGAVTGKIPYMLAAKTAAVGAAVVVVRAIASKVELSNNAKNPDLPNVTARPVNPE